MLHRSRPSIVAPLAVLLLMVLAACGESSASGPDSSSDGSIPSGGAPPEVDGNWQLTSGTVDGKPIGDLTAGAVTLTIDGPNVSGRSACNSYTGVAEFDGSTVRFGSMGGTAMGCEPPVMDLETAYLAALAKIDSIKIDSGELVLTGPAVSLRFEPVRAVDDRDLVDTVWTLDSLLFGGTASSVVGTPGILQLSADGSVTFTTGCFGGAGTYTVADGKLNLTLTTAADAKACVGQVKSQADQILAVLSGNPPFSIEGALLTLYDDRTPAGRGLVYRAEGPAS